MLSATLKVGKLHYIKIACPDTHTHTHTHTHTRTHAHIPVPFTCSWIQLLNYQL